MFNQLKELEKKSMKLSIRLKLLFSYPSSFKIRKAEQDSLHHHLPAFETDELLEKVEQ